MLVESGLVKASTSDGQEFVFRPSLGRIASLGAPHEIVSIFAGLHGQNAAKEAAYVLACLCDQDDATPLTGWIDGDGQHHAGLMPEAEQILIAQHLMKHGMVGKAKPSKGDGKFTDKFDAAEYIAAARVHLGLSSSDAAALSMTEFQAMFEMKFPQQCDQKPEVASLEEYQAGMAALKAIQERKRG